MRPKSRARPPLALDDRRSSPAYLQIFRQVERYTVSGRLRSGDQLPTVRELAAQLGINFNTVARAYRLLQRAGIVAAQQGRGTFVLDRSLPQLSNGITLQTLTSQYIAEARRRDFDAAQISAMVTRLLGS